jgi:methionine-rich copper-binding protein CopC
MVTRALPLTFALTVAALAPVSAEAHAFLERADPRVGSVVAKAPPTLRLTFTEGIVVPFCRVTVTGPPGFDGAGAPHAVPGDARSLAVDLKGAAPPGGYTVRWRVLSVDTHVTEGDFTFQVRPQVAPGAPAGARP